MFSIGSNRFLLNNNEGETLTLARMVKDENRVEDVEEGEISDTASVEEITAEDFNKPDVVEIDKPKISDSRVYYNNMYKYQLPRNYPNGLYNFAWAQAVQNKTLDDAFVEFKQDENSTRLSMSSSGVAASVNVDDKNSSVSSLKEVDKVIIDDSSDEEMKDGGELEEGEIDLDSDFIPKLEEQAISDGFDLKSMNVEKDLKIKDSMERIKSNCEVLELVKVAEAEKYYNRVCSELRNNLESLWEICVDYSHPEKVAIVEISYRAIQAANSVFCRMNEKQKEQNVDALSRILNLAIGQVHPLFSDEQMKEIENMMNFLNSTILATKVFDKEKEINAMDRMNTTGSDASADNTGYDLFSSRKPVLESLSVKSLIQNDRNIGMAPLNSGFSNFKSRWGFGPLLDLHKDHDMDSLPSPTRETPPYLPLQNALPSGDGLIKPEAKIIKMAHETPPYLPSQNASSSGDGFVKTEFGTVKTIRDKEGPRVRHYETDALKAFSTYQQKFGRNSFNVDSRLPSPTPSEEGNGGDVDTSEEVSSSSSSNVRNIKPVSTTFVRPIISPHPQVDNALVQGLANSRNVGPVSSGSNPASRASAKSRDPRLRYASPDVGALDRGQRPMLVGPTELKTAPMVPGGIMNPRKNKIGEETVLDGPMTKKQRNGDGNLFDGMDVKNAPGVGGWLEESGPNGPQAMVTSQAVQIIPVDPRKLENGVISSGSASATMPSMAARLNEQPPVINASTAASLPALLRDIAVNPSMLMSFLMGQQKLAGAETVRTSGDPAQKTANPLSSSSTLSSNSSSILGAGSSSILGAVPVPLVNVAASKPSVLGQPPALLPLPSQIPQSEELGKIRMKPRDPRRALHTNTFQSGVSGSQTKGAVTPSPHGSSKENLNVQKQDENKGNTSSGTSQSIVPPDIARQFTKNLKNIADIISVTQPSTTTPPVAQIPPPSLQTNSDNVVPDSNDLQIASVLKLEQGSTGPSQSQNTWEDVEHLFEGYNDQQKAAIQKERTRRIEEQKKMFAARKLSLVLDLDHTLLNSAKFIEVETVHEEILRKKEEQDRENTQRHLFRFQHMGMWTKLRPGIWNFLEKASKLFELHLYTMGNKLYATEMAKVLDPKGTLFSGRVLSKGDDGDPFDGDERVPKSKDLDGVLGMESAVVIIDDSIRVWPHNKLNLIVVERYTYFPCSRRQFGLLGPSLLEIDHDERAEDGTLASSLSVIERIHQDFFSNESLEEVDVRNILASEQRKILSGCKIVFSRVFPVGEVKPHLHPLWQTAEQFGAVCTNQIDEQVTHVVANSLGTDKVNWARSTGRFVVHPGWVEASALLYRRANEQDFAIKS